MEISDEIHNLNRSMNETLSKTQLKHIATKYAVKRICIVSSLTIVTIHPLLPRKCIGKYHPRDSIS